MVCILVVVVETGAALQQLLLVLKTFQCRIGLRVSLEASFVRRRLLDDATWSILTFLEPWVLVRRVLIRLRFSWCYIRSVVRLIRLLTQVLHANPSMLTINPVLVRERHRKRLSFGGSARLVAKHAAGVMYEGRMVRLPDIRWASLPRDVAILSQNRYI